MRKGDEFIGYVERVTFPNKGQVRVIVDEVMTEVIVVVKNAIPGQLIRGRVIKKRQQRLQGRLLEVMKKAIDEQPALCSVFGDCGGCLYQTLPYQHQLALKEQQVKEILAPFINQAEWQSILGSPQALAYRNKMEYSFGDQLKDGPLTLGLHRRASTYDIVPTTDCVLVTADFNRIVDYTLAFFRRKGLDYYHRRTHQGYLRYLLVRAGKKTTQLQVNLVTTSQWPTDGQILNSAVVKPMDIMTEEAVLAEWQAGLRSLPLEAELVSILQTVSDSLSDAVKPEKVHLLYGQQFFYEELLGLTFKISAFSFFQTNSLGAEVLYRKVRDYVGDTKDKLIYDLYSGTGTITQLLSAVAKEVVGVEIVEEAVEAAKQNAALNGLTNCRFIAGDVLQVLDSLTAKPDIIILDPPRDGIHPKALPKIIDYGVAKIVYVSCKPTSLARDLEAFTEAGYVVERVGCVDMFPMTSHVETIIGIQKKESVK